MVFERQRHGIRETQRMRFLDSDGGAADARVSAADLENTRLAGRLWAAVAEALIFDLNLYKYRKKSG
jgi:hypothetical protein